VKEGYLQELFLDLIAPDADSGKYLGRIFSARTSGWRMTNDFP
jgi:hypothetical protein